MENVSYSVQGPRFPWAEWSIPEQHQIRSFARSLCHTFDELEATNMHQPWLPIGRVSKLSHGPTLKGWALCWSHGFPSPPNYLFSGLARMQSAPRYHPSSIRPAPSLPASRESGCVASKPNARSRILALKPGHIFRGISSEPRVSMILRWFLIHAFSHP